MEWSSAALPWSARWCGPDREIRPGPRQESPTQEGSPRSLASLPFPFAVPDVDVDVRDPEFTIEVPELFEIDISNQLHDRELGGLGSDDDDAARDLFSRAHENLDIVLVFAAHRDNPL